MRLLDQLQRRFLNFCWLQYSPAELWEFVRLRWTRRHIPASLRHYPYPWHGNTLYFDGILVISLPFRHDRRAHSRRQMNHFSLSYSFLEAIHGQSINPATMDQARFTRSTLRYLPQGSLGCALSHIQAWQQVLDQGWQYGLIFEDDVVLTETFVEDLRTCMPEVPPDFDLLYLGSGLTAPTTPGLLFLPTCFSPTTRAKGCTPMWCQQREPANCWNTSFRFTWPMVASIR